MPVHISYSIMVLIVQYTFELSWDLNKKSIVVALYIIKLLFSSLSPEIVMSCGKYEPNMYVINA